MLGPARIASRPLFFSEGVELPEITLDVNDRIDWAVKEFKRRVQRSGILRELRRRRHHVKPSAARILKSKAAQRARDKAKRKRSPR